VKILAIDIETSPILASVWSIWQQNVGLSQIHEATEMLCFVAKWVGEPGIEFHAGRYAPGGDSPAMVQRAHELLDQADAVLSYNGRRFDVPHLNREFIEAGLTPPSPFRHIDLLETCRKRFKWPSNKLAYVTKVLGLQGKIETTFDLWKGCLDGDPASWRKMERYNRRDVTQLEALYRRLLPWIQSPPNAGLDPANEGLLVCPSCGSERLVKRGYAQTSVSLFQQYRCSNCGRYSRSGKRDVGVDLRAVAE